jgi:hypothetical protein
MDIHKVCRLPSQEAFGSFKAYICMKMEKISRQIALAKRPAKAFMSETSRYVTNKPWNPGLTEGHDASMRCASRDAHGIEPDAGDEEAS